MILLYAVAFVLFVSFLIYTKWSHSYWSRRGIIGPVPIPIFGNMLEYFKMQKHFGEVYHEIYQEFPDAAYVGFYKFADPAVLVRSVSLAKSILMDNFKCFQANDVHLERDLDPLLSMNPFFVHGAEWKHKRSQVTPILTAAKVKAAFPLVRGICQRFAEYIGRFSAQEFEARHLSSQFTIESVASCAFGVEADAFTNGRSSFVENTKKMFEISTLQSIRLTATFFLPTISRMVNLSYLPGSVDFWLRSVIKQVISYRDAKPTERRSDLLQSVLDLRNRKGATIIDEETIVGHALTILTDGYETSSGAICYCFYQLAVNPDIQRRLQCEIDEVMADCGGQLTDEALKRLVYTEQVIYETLRLHTPDFSLNKLCTEDFELPPQFADGKTGVTVTAGTSVVIPVYSLHRDPELYPDPLRFDPARFTDAAIAARPKCSFLGFGEGPRMCPGIRFALMQSKAAIATVMSQFDVQLSARTQEPLTFSKVSLMMTCDDGIYVNFKKRQCASK